MGVIRFGESGDDRWYETEDNEVIQCDETIIDHLWWQYIINPTAKRADNDIYTIFEVTEPKLKLK